MVKYVYDVSGNRTKRTLLSGAYADYVPEELNRISSQTNYYTDPKTIRFDYGFDPLGRRQYERGGIGVSPRIRAENGAEFKIRNWATSFSWSSGTQGQSYVYDNASRLTSLSNGEAEITYTYDDANRKLSEQVTTKSYGLNSTRTVSYRYDADGNREWVTYPQGNKYLYHYTGRNQLADIQLDPALFGAQYATPMVKYVYDVGGNRTKRTAFSGAYADYTPDELNRISSQTDFFTVGGSIRFDYAFDALGRRKYERRDLAQADGFKYNLRDELTNYNREGTLQSNGSVTGGSTVMSTLYDPNGNRTSTTANGGTTTFAPNNLNQYTNTSAHGALGYDGKGNLTTIDGWSYTYDAQNWLTNIDKGTVHIVQHYDPLNRIIARDNNGVITTNVWDGWNLIEERGAAGAVKRCYLYGAAQNEVVQAFGGGAANMWYWQDGRGNTAAVSGDAGKLLERYRYGWQGSVSFYNAANVANTNQSESPFGTRFLFAGSLYQPETGLYDMRNRFYHPTLSRFLQTDPIGFKGDALNLYRYCGNDFANRSDPMGLMGEIFDAGELESARATARHQVEAAVSDPNRQSATALILRKGERVPRPQKFYPSKMVPVFSRGKGYEVGPTIDGQIRTISGETFELEIPPKSLQGRRTVYNAHSHNNKRGDTKTPGLAVADWSRYDKAINDVDRMDESNGKWHFRRNGNEVSSDKASRSGTANNTSLNGATGSSVNAQSAAPSAKDVDLAHQATGVPSLGQEAVNFAPGRP